MFLLIPPQYLNILRKKQEFIDGNTVGRNFLELTRPQDASLLTAYKKKPGLRPVSLS